MLMFRFAVLAAAGVFFAGCSSAGSSSGEGTHGGPPTRGGERASVPESSPHITGVITEVLRAHGTEGSLGKMILVEEDPKGCAKVKPDKGCHKLYLYVTQKTLIFRKGATRKPSPGQGPQILRGARGCAPGTPAC